MSNLENGIAAYKAGKRDEARKYFIAALKEDQTNERVWGWMYQVANNDAEKIECMKRALAINPNNTKAKEILDQLNTSKIETIPPAPKMKKCPHCAEMINADANVCRYCQKNVDPNVIKAEKMGMLGKQLQSLGCQLTILAPIVICICIFIASLVSGSFTNSTSKKTVESYMQEYGGNPDVYNEILSINDCEILQEQFDTAENNLQEPGTTQRQWGMGYMEASDERMKEIGCYK